MSLQRRTDLATEAKQLWEQSAVQQTKLEGVRAREGEEEGFPVTIIDILDQRGAKALGKEIGSYVTLDLTTFFQREEGSFVRAVRAIAHQLEALLPSGQGTCLVVGLGNRAITPDVIGPRTTDHCLVTRHLVEQVPEHFGQFRPVAAVAAGVLGTTGVESGELVGSLVTKLQPSCVIAIDALASRATDRVCTTVQLSDTGIVPGSGVGNHRFPLNQQTLGVPVIAVGVPTVVEVSTLAADLLEESGQGHINPATLGREGASMLVTPRDIDQKVADLSKLLGYAINLALQKGLTVEDLDLLLS